MKIWAISDLHLNSADAAKLVAPSRMPRADVCVVAGDVCERPSMALNWLSRVIRPRMPVVYVMGNHEYYGCRHDIAVKDARMIAEATGITLLDDGEAVIGGVRFVGGTLWTDFALFEGRADGPDTKRAMKACSVSVADFGEIRVLDAVDGRKPERTVRPGDMASWHARTRGFIASAMAQPHAGPTVVVTHHAPHPRSVASRFAADPVTAAFASDLSPLVEDGGAALWIHGHMHDACDYQAGGARVYCNPRGYAHETSGWDPMGTVTVA